MFTKYSTIAVALFGLWHGSCLAEEPMSDNDKVMYSLGYELGQDIKSQKLELAPEILLQGAKDAIDANEPLVNKAAQNKALKNIKAQRAQENLEQAKAFMADNAKKEGVVSLDSGLQYRVIQEGNGKTPKYQDKVVVHYRGNFIDGTEFDNTYEREKPKTFEVEKIIRGWREALLLMKEGAKWELFVPPELAFGKRGRPKVIPPNSALIYEVELLSVKEGEMPANAK